MIHCRNISNGRSLRMRKSSLSLFLSSFSSLYWVFISLMKRFIITSMVNEWRSEVLLRSFAIDSALNCLLTTRTQSVNDVLKCFGRRLLHHESVSSGFTLMGIHLHVCQHKRSQKWIGCRVKPFSVCSLLRFGLRKSQQHNIKPGLSRLMPRQVLNIFTHQHLAI